MHDLFGNSATHLGYSCLMPTLIAEWFAELTPTAIKSCQACFVEPDSWNY